MDVEVGRCYLSQAKREREIRDDVDTFDFGKEFAEHSIGNDKA